MSENNVNNNTNTNTGTNTNLNNDISITTMITFKDIITNRDGHHYY